MKTENAEVELSEYDKIMTLENNEDYFLSRPEICVPKVSINNLMSINKCRDFNISSMDDYRLLVIPDGGIDLNQFAEKIKDMENNTKNKKQIMDFWLSGHILLKGIKEMLEKGIIHHDLKPGNIVYDTKTKQLKFIDFGLWIIKKILSKISVNHHTHWLDHIGIFHLNSVY